MKYEFTLKYSFYKQLQYYRFIFKHSKEIIELEEKLTEATHKISILLYFICFFSLRIFFENDIANPISIILIFPFALFYSLSTIVRYRNAIKNWYKMPVRRITIRLYDTHYNILAETKRVFYDYDYEYFFKNNETIKVYKFKNKYIINAGCQKCVFTLREASKYDLKAIFQFIELKTNGNVPACDEIFSFDFEFYKNIIPLNYTEKVK